MPAEAGDPFKCNKEIEERSNVKCCKAKSKSKAKSIHFSSYSVCTFNLGEFKKEFIDVGQ